MFFAFPWVRFCFLVKLRQFLRQKFPVFIGLPKGFTVDFKKVYCSPDFCTEFQNQFNQLVFNLLKTRKQP
ncbi:hypothetical protein D2V93_06895 [Flagellimonas taeanensis]|nr:hypothetical protein D2V93_06895 [Allomuricauda taeanensis]